MKFIDAAFSTLAAQSWKIGCLICILGILRWAIRGRVPQQILFGTWIIVALALLFPVSIPVAWNPVTIASRPLSVASEGLDSPAGSARRGVQNLLSNLDWTANPTIQSLGSSSHSWTAASVAACVWLIGAVALLAIRAGLWHRFRGRLGHSAVPVNPKYTAAIVECAQKLGVKTPISVIESDAAVGPAMGGLWRPYLVIPSSLGKQLSDEELRLVILHELGHWRRRDAAVNVLVQCALAVHWFNPAAWLFAGMARFDCELACDEFVLAHVAMSGPDVYGKTILKVLATVQRRNAPTAVLGILGGKQQIERRIHMIARFRTASFSRIAAGCCLIGLVAIAAVTSKLKASSSDTAQPASSSPAGQATLKELKRYESSEWKFAIDTPTNWNRFPPVSSNSPYEVVRFQSIENGIHDLLIVFRSPRDPSQSPTEWLQEMQKVLEKGGFGNFVVGKTTIGSRAVLTLDFDKAGPDGGLWSCRHYMVTDGTLGYVLGFGTNKREQMADLQDRIAKSFQILE